MSERIFRHLLVPADGSDASVAAARLAFRTARAFGARVDLLYVIDLLLCEELRRFDQRELDEIRAELHEQGERILNVLREEGQRMGLDVASKVVRGDPFEEIVDQARERGADLIVMGSHIPRFLDLGSHGGHLASLSHHSVMLVRDEA